jgi:hypothetical protein
VNDLNRRSAARSRNAVPKGEVSGVLETLAAGISAVFQRPYLVLLPLLVDLWAWLGVQIRADAMISAMQDVLIEHGERNGATVANELDGVAERLRVNDVLATLTPSVFSGLPADSFLNILLGLVAPAMTAGVDRTTMYADWSQGLGRTLTPDQWQAVIGYGFVFFVVATLLLVLFKVPLAQAVRGGDWPVRTIASDFLLGWVRLVGLIGLVVAALLLIGLPVLVAAQILLMAGINLVALLSLVLFIVGAMIAVYTFFLLDAMFIYRVGPIQAGRMSYAVARVNLGQTWRFAAASILIATGLLQVWDVIVENPPGVIFALVANAVIGTGLSVASMMFFHDRARLPRPGYTINTYRWRRDIPPRPH